MKNPIHLRAELAIIERAASNLEQELPAFPPELILAGPMGDPDEPSGQQRMYRLHHPTALDEDFYVLVTVRTMDRLEAVGALGGETPEEELTPAAVADAMVEVELPDPEHASAEGRQGQ